MIFPCTAVVFYPFALELICRQGRLEEARQSLAWLREGGHYLEEEHEILEVDAFIHFSFEKFIIDG